VGAIILALNFLLIPTMSYGSAIATIAAYGSMMSISYYLGTILSHSLRFKENRLSLAIHTFQPYHFMVSERTIMWESVY
jgi:O-antigen/teichoic acid export membrane protein